MKKLLFIILASSLGITGCVSTGASDNINKSRDYNKQKPAKSANMKQAMDACARSTGVQMTKESRPSKSDMQKLESCMSAKGYQMPQGQGRPSKRS